MRIKQGASIAGLHPCMRRALVIGDQVLKNFGVNFIITSGLDSTHSAGSLHYYGFAIDIRTRHMDDPSTVHKALKDQLAGYDVVLERNHIHIENEIEFRRLYAS